MTRTNQIVEFEVAADIRRAGGCIGKGDAKLVADTVNQWKCGAIAIAYYSSFGMSRDVEKFRSSVKPVVEAAIHDALITGRQVFLLNMLGNWPAYPELEEPSEPEGYWWMRILYERSTLQVFILTPVYRAYRNQGFWSIFSMTITASNLEKFFNYDCNCTKPRQIFCQLHQAPSYRRRYRPTRSW